MYEEPKQHWYDKVIYFLIAHQVMIKRMFIFLFVFICIIIWVLGIIGWINYTTSTKKHNYDISLIKNDLVDYIAYKAVHAPRDIQIVLATAVDKDGNIYDFVAKVKNLNEEWAAESITYKFSYTGGVTESRTDYLMPGSEKYLFVFSEETKFNVSQANLIIENIDWYRINNDSNLSILPNLTIEDESFERQNQSTAVGFTVSNLTPYNFWAVGWQVVLYQGDNPVAVNYLTTNNFLSLSEREVQVTWFNDLPTPSKIDIIADINVLSDDIFMKKDFGPGQPKGLDFR
ncbi:MAG: hypothetical protein ABIA91_02085 [Patescibacteria group bacterium]